MISTLFTPEWCAWLYWVTSKVLPPNNSPSWTESPSTLTSGTTALVSLFDPYVIISSLLRNFWPWTSVRYNVSNVVLIAVTVPLNPAPLNTLTSPWSMVTTSPILYPDPPEILLKEVITPPEWFTVAVASVPPPVRETIGILLVLEKLYPEPPNARVIPLLVGLDPWPSINPVILSSSDVDTAPELIFLPIGNWVFVLVPFLIFNFNFLGNPCKALSDISCVLKLPASIGGLKNVTVPVGTNDAFLSLNVKSEYWLGVHIVPFCDLNKLPPKYCFPTTTLSTSGRLSVLTVFSFIVAIHISYLSEDGDKNTRAYSFFGSR